MQYIYCIFIMIRNCWLFPRNYTRQNYLSSAPMIINSIPNTFQPICSSYYPIDEKIIYKKCIDYLMAENKYLIEKCEEYKAALEFIVQNIDIKEVDEEQEEKKESNENKNTKE
jgi:hypothetical protein